MKKLALLLMIFLVGCSNKNEQFLKDYYKTIESCQMTDIMELNVDLEMYYQDCSRLLQYVDNEFVITKETKIDNMIELEVKNKNLNNVVIWQLINEDNHLKILKFWIK